MSTSFATTRQVLGQALTGIVEDTLVQPRLEAELPSPASGPANLRGAAPTEKTRNFATSRIAIKTNGRILFVDIAEVAAVEAEGNYVLLHHKASAHLLRESISTVEEKLRRYGFLRIHRSVLVNAARVLEIRRLPSGEYLLRLSNGKEYAVTRTYRKNLRCVSLTCLGGEF